MTGHAHDQVLLACAENLRRGINYALDLVAIVEDRGPDPAVVKPLLCAVDLMGRVANDLETTADIQARKEHP